MAAKTRKQLASEVRAYKKEVERRDERFQAITDILAEYGVESPMGPGHGVRKMGGRLRETEKKLEQLQARANESVDENHRARNERDLRVREVVELKSELRRVGKFGTTMLRVVEILAEKFPG